MVGSNVDVMIYCRLGRAKATMDFFFIKLSPGRARVDISTRRQEMFKATTVVSSSSQERPMYVYIHMRQYPKHRKKVA